VTNFFTRDFNEIIQEDMHRTVYVRVRKVSSEPELEPERSGSVHAYIQDIPSDFDGALWNHIEFYKIQLSDHSSWLLQSQFQSRKKTQTFFSIWFTRGTWVGMERWGGGCAIPLSRMLSTSRQPYIWKNSFDRNRLIELLFFPKCRCCI
jgi:hypothetical protein